MNEKIVKLENIKKLKPYLKGVRKTLFFKYGLDMLDIVLKIILPLVVAQILVYFTKFDFEKIVYYTLIACIISIFSAILQGGALIFNQRWIRQVTYNLQCEISAHYLNTQSKALNKVNSGEITSRFITDTNKMSFSLNRALTEVLKSLISVAYIVISFFINPYIAAYLLFVGGYTYITNTFLAKMQANNDYMKGRKSDVINGYNNEMVRGWQDIKGLGFKDCFLEKINYLNREYKKFSLKCNDRISKHKMWVFATQAVLCLCFYILCGWFVLNGWLTFAGFLVLYMYSERIIGSLNSIQVVKEELYTAEVCAKRVFELYDETHFPTEKFGDKNLEISGKIECKNVCFGYNPNINVLKHINFEIEPHTLVAIVGESGTGKSTILELISKKYEVVSGEICIDGVNINELSEQNLRDNICYVTQTPYIFNVSIAENLKFVKPNVSDDEIKSICKKVKLDKYIQTLPQKYDSVIGENGVKFSGGQRQRLAIARALLKNSRIILFDEATSALDNVSQKEIKKLLFKLKKEHTIIVVAHRLSTIVDADKIFVINAGQVVGQGTHNELLENCDKYRELYKANT